MSTTTQPETTTIPLPGPPLSTYDRQARFLDLAERLAPGDGSIPPAICMHLGHIYGVATSPDWPDDLRRKMLRDVVEHGALYNTAASEPGLGSPSRGGSYATTAEQTLSLIHISEPTRPY